MIRYYIFKGSRHLLIFIMILIEILTVTELGIFKGDKKGNLRTKGTFTRAEMEQIIKNAFPYSVKAPH
ncbi:S-layer homology domain-containing protein [Bacillus thuringiensis]|uniref:S-layer homology domain-containing protein n=1 Tax=Bacillus thuringiensis TaxID=1428 RepID=A0AAW9JI23_BACTU|nr:S-layer homology domain-containing protein [Bacillus thuringiensis]MDZ5479464.1 S-layer homology domain-containing protein [Bacillus thuringiensis]